VTREDVVIHNCSPSRCLFVMSYWLGMQGGEKMSLITSNIVGDSITIRAFESALPAGRGE